MACTTIVVVTIISHSVEMSWEENKVGEAMA